MPGGVVPWSQEAIPMRTSFLAIAVGVSALSVSVANAADLYQPPPASSPIYAPTPVASWTGFYLGIHGGGAWGNSTSNSPADFSVNGPYVGAQAGYNWQFGGPWVLGVEADISWSGVNGVRSPPAAPVTTTQDLDWFGTIRGRLGYSMGDWMPYVTGGWAYGSATRTNSGFLGGTASASHTGWTAGLGVEWAFAQNWTMKGEYKYVDFGSSTYTYSPGGGVNSVDMKLHTLELGLNYKF